MADDLGDEWWLKGENATHDESSEDNSTTEVSLTKTKEKKIDKKRANKRKSEDVVEDDTNNKKLKSSKQAKVAKQKKSIVESSNRENQINGDSPVKKKRKNKRPKKKISEELSGKTLPPASSADFLRVLKTAYSGKLSKVEWDDIQLENRDFGPSNATSDGAANSYLQCLVPEWSGLLAQPDLKAGSPFVLILAGSGARAVDINREIQKFKGKSCRCAKLFAKHFKLDEQAKYLCEKVCHMGIGTPNRIAALVKSDALKLDNLVLVVIDWNWMNIKFEKMIDIPQVKTDLLDIFKNHFIPHIRNSSCKIGIL